MQKHSHTTSCQPAATIHSEMAGRTRRADGEDLATQCKRSRRRRATTTTAINVHRNPSLLSSGRRVQTYSREDETRFTKAIHERVLHRGQPATAIDRSDRDGAGSVGNSGAPWGGEGRGALPALHCSATGGMVHIFCRPRCPDGAARWRWQPKSAGVIVTL